MFVTCVPAQVSFASVVDAIHDCAFVASPLPLVLSLEMHCSVRTPLTLTLTLT
jgi:hypothetical protein